MVSRMLIAVAVMMQAAMLGGCWDAQGRITGSSIQAFWTRVDENWRRDLGRLGLAPPARSRDLRGPAGRPAAAGEARGTVFASRQGDLIVVDAKLANVPSKVKTLAAGLKLRNGVVVPPKTIGFVHGATDHHESAPRGEFDFNERPAPRTPVGRAELCLRVTYAVDRTVSVDRGVFTLVLGEPTGSMSCSQGITAAISVDDGGPTLTGCVLLPPEDDVYGPPRPLVPEPDAATVSFELRLDPARAGPDGAVWITPRLASIHPDRGPRKTITARAPLPEDIP